MNAVRTDHWKITHQHSVGGCQGYILNILFHPIVKVGKHIKKQSMNSIRTMWFSFFPVWLEDNVCVPIIRL